MIGVQRLKLNDFLLFPTTTQGMPTVEATDFIPEKLEAYKAKNKPRTRVEGALHFFVDDIRFENLWKFPFRQLNYLQKFQAVCGPDFSLYLDYPQPLKIWNTYRNRWLSRFWSEQGLTVIPCVSWAEPESFNYCFDGLPQHSVLAIASMGISKKDRNSINLLLQGAEVMLERLKPSTVLVYGEKMKNELQSLNTEDVFRFYPYYRRGQK